MKPFEIFRTGRQTPMKGDAIVFAETDLAAIAAGYDPDKHHAPIVVGHPETNLPAYGWVKKISVSGDRLVATPDELDPAFTELVAAGRFKKVSAAFYHPDSKGNPTPGAYYLRHVGFLGAQPPAVKGLKAIEFAAPEDDMIVVEFADWSVAQIGSAVSRIFRRMRDLMIADRGIEVADQALPEWEIESLMRAGIEAEPGPASLGFSDPTLERNPMSDPSNPAPDAAALIAQANDLKARELAFSEREAKARATADAAFVTSVVAEGRLPKALEAQTVALFSELDEDVLEFGEGADAVKTTGRAAFRDLLSKLPVPVKTGELLAGGDETIDFSDPVATADLIVTEIRTAKEKGEEISSAVALGRLKKRAAE